jgi:hypothetical protein
VYGHGLYDSSEDQLRFVFVAEDKVPLHLACDRDVVARVVAVGHAAVICGDLLAGRLRLIEYSADLLRQASILGENIRQLHLQCCLKVLVFRRGGHPLRSFESGRVALDLSHQPSKSGPGDFPNFVSRILHNLFERLATDELSGFGRCGQVMVCRNSRRKGYIRFPGETKKS